MLTGMLQKKVIWICGIVMTNEVDVIWRKGDGEMPPEAKHVVDVVKGEALLRSLDLPSDIADEIRYNAEKNAQSVNSYISSMIKQMLAAS